MAEEHSKIKNDILLRVRLLYLLFFLAGAVVLLRLLWVQFFSSEIAINAVRLESRIFLEQPVPAQRGSILSRNGEPLATSIFRYQVAFDFGSEGLDSIQTFNQQSDSLSKLLSAFFKDRTPAAYSRMFRENHARHYRLTNPRDTTYLRSEGRIARFFDRLRGEEFVTKRLFDTIRNHKPIDIFPREVDYAEWEILRRYPLLNWNMGMVYNLRQSDERVYPHRELARRTIGKIIGEQGTKGNYGIEDAYYELLAGRDGKARMQRIARGFYSRVPGAEQQNPVDGADIITTLDMDLQDVADKTLRRQLETQNAIWGTTLVMETHTGDLLAMVNLGRDEKGGYSEQKNYALGARMEPGSTFKLAAMLALVEDQKANLSLSYDTGNGRPVMVGKALIQDSHGGYNLVNLKTATAQSLNVYFASAIYEAYKDNPKRYTDFLKGLHLDRPMGLEKLGEATPIFPEPGKRIWYPHITLPNMGYGYGIELAPIQTLTLYNAVANGGRMVAPRIIREIRRGDEVLEKHDPTVLVDKVCSSSALAKIRECLEEVARTGTAATYFRDTTRLRVGAKTGTAKFAQGEIKYNDGYYLGTMVAYLPADKPRYTVLTAIFTRRGYGTTYYGAGLAGVVQQQVTNYLFNRRHDWSTPVAESGRANHPSRIKGGDIAQIRRIADRFSPRTSFEDRNGWGSVAIDSMANVRIANLPSEATLMPDIRGMGLKDALFLLENRGLKVDFTGSGAVTQQSIAPDTRIQSGGAVTIILDQR